MMTTESYLSQSNTASLFDNNKNALSPNAQLLQQRLQQIRYNEPLSVALRGVSPKGKVNIPQPVIGNGIMPFTRGAFKKIPPLSNPMINTFKSGGVIAGHGIYYAQGAFIFVVPKGADPTQLQNRTYVDMVAGVNVNEIAHAAAKSQDFPEDPNHILFGTFTMKDYADLLRLENKLNSHDIDASRARDQYMKKINELEKNLLAALNRVAELEAEREENSPQIEIQINKTDEKEEDDLVMLNNGFSVKKQGERYVSVRPTVTGYIRAVNSDKALLINVSSDNNQIDFKSTTQAQWNASLQVTLPANGEWVPIEISGNTVSQIADDVKIKAHVINTNVSAQQDMTVFWFESGLKLDAPSFYKLTQLADGSVRYRPRDGTVAMYGRGTAKVIPQLKLDSESFSSIKQLSMQLRFIQNFEHAVQLKNGTITPESKMIITFSFDEQNGTTNTDLQLSYMQRVLHQFIAKNRYLTIKHAQGTRLIDNLGTGINNTSPFYNLEIRSLEQRLSIKPNGEITASADIDDTPHVSAPPETILFTGPFTGTVTYPVKRIEIKDNFRLWLVIENDNGVLTPIKETTWHLDVNSDDVFQGASVPMHEGFDPKEKPVLTGVSANDWTNNPANMYRTYDGEFQF